MISYLKGKYIDRTDEGSLIINVNGIGFEVFVPGEVLGRASFAGDEDIELFTYMQVKEDGMSLFGFSTMDEKIISVSGIGPKGGISILSTLNREQLIMAILDENSDLIAKAPGIGKKTAAKLVLELKDKFKLADALSGGSSIDMNDTAPVSKADDGIVKDAIAALVSLGYTSAESTKAVRAVQITEDMTVDKLLSLSLRNI